MAFDPAFAAVAVAAVFIVALAKSGLLGSVSILGVPLLTLVMPAREAAGMMLPILVVMDAIGVIAYRREVHWPNLKVLLPGAAIGIGVGWAFWAATSEGAVRLLIGVIALIFVLDAWLPLRGRLQGRPPSRPWGVLWGAVAGFTSFVSHTGGPPCQIYTLPQRLPPAVYAGTTVVFFAVVNAAKVIPYVTLGQINIGSLTRTAALVPVAVAGMLVGIYLVRRISTGLFYRIAYALVFALALKLIWDGAAAVWSAG
ncbi:MAG TPA: sulfite exporter TauE/SafE family protein [Devosiaceae bacterium]|nr:sulfite exporter TauE/SafE family protein [Devosiaceae bacterium]